MHTSSSLRPLPAAQDLLSRELSRRRFVQGLALGGLALGLGWPRLSAATAVPALQGPVFDLTIGSTTVNLTGRARRAVTVNGMLPAPVLHCREGDRLLLRVHNTLAEDSSIHWHGLQLPANMDGVPGFSFHGIPPGRTFVYEFLLRQSGTYWYHSHSAMQEAIGLYGALVIAPREPEPFGYDREHVIVLSDWSDTAPQAILARLKKQSGYYNHHQPTVGDFLRDVRKSGWSAAWADRAMWGRMRMNPTDLADVSADAYTYLVNGTTPAGNWTGLFRPGETMRLRFINAAAMTYFDVRIPGLTMTVVAADGRYVRPVDVDEFRLGVAETLDVIVTPTENAHTVFAQSMDRSGYACATLATAAGLVAAVPALDPRPRLTMADMGMDHSMMEAMPDMPAQAHPASEENNPGVDMQVMMPMARLDDPGIGLRAGDRSDEGRKVLAYADLHSAFDDPDGREPARDIELHLTGNMERYTWSFDGIPFDDAEPILLKYGERVRFVLVNDTMMEHPVHLHGMWSDLEDDDGNFLVRKHTISIPPGTRRSFRVTADALGRWAFHCHLLMHMDTGMFREVRVEA